ncbi:MAG: transposase [Nitrospirae bacterium]|nr:transposase [Nitrospirota bacterium]
MARPLRIEYEGALYHVTARGNERKKIYFTKTDYERFLYYISEAQKKFGIKIICYVLMSNHYHLVIETPEANLSKAMHYINGSYTTYINVKRKRSGHLFQGRYKAIIVDRDNYLLELSRYVHLNPVRAKMVQNPEEYFYSSYKTFITNNENKILNELQVLEMISEVKGYAKQEYKRFVEAEIGKKNDDPLRNVYGGIILGSIGFIKETLRKIKDDFIQKEQISHSRALRSECTIEEIFDIVSNHYNTGKDDIKKKKDSRVRKIAIYLIKRNTSATNKEIGKIFGRIHPTTVSKIYERFKKEFGKSWKLRREIIKVENKISHVEP